MKPILFIDANIFAKFDYNTLKNYIAMNNIVLTDDIVKEILAKKDTLMNLSGFKEKFRLFFNNAGGLNDNIYLILSHVPFGIGNVFSNTKNTLNLKAKAKVCSAHHLWLPAIVQPALITSPKRHLNSEITWRLRRGEIDFNDGKWQDEINKNKVNQLESAKKYYQESDVNVNKLFNTWIKRNKDIQFNKYKISDSRLIAHALDTMIAFKTNVTVISADYDVLDLKNNLFASIIDKYVIYEVLKQECMLIDLQEEHMLITVPMAKIYDIHEQVVKRLEKSENGLLFSVDFYNTEKETHNIFDNIIPEWLLEFIEDYKENLDCFALKEEYYKKYPIQYLWHADWSGYYREYQIAIEKEKDKKETVFFPPSIKFEVWKRDTSKPIASMREMQCKVFCKYEMDEINNPDKISEFHDINEIKCKKNF